MFLQWSKHDGVKRGPQFTEKYFSQTMDHFNFNSMGNSTFSQRYLITGETSVPFLNRNDHMSEWLLVLCFPSALRWVLAQRPRPCFLLHWQRGRHLGVCTQLWIHHRISCSAGSLGHICWTCKKTLVHLMKQYHHHLWVDFTGHVTKENRKWMVDVWLILSADFHTHNRPRTIIVKFLLQGHVVSTAKPISWCNCGPIIAPSTPHKIKIKNKHLQDYETVN